MRSLERCVVPSPGRYSSGNRGGVSVPARRLFSTIAGVLYELSAILWGLGFDLFPTIAGTTDTNGVVTDLRWTEAMNQMYDAAMANPVKSDNGDITAVGFNNEAAVFDWTMLSVKNPDIAFSFQRILQGLAHHDVHGASPTPP